MATRLLLLSESEVNRWKNKKAIDIVIPILFMAIVEWGCSKLPGESFETFLKKKSRKGSWENYIKRFKPYPEKLRETDCSTFDVSFLLTLIPEVCEDIAANGTPVWKTDDYSMLEWHLTLAKEIRNDVSHQPKGSAVDPKKLGEIEKVVIEALKVAGDKYKVPQQTVDRKIGDVLAQVKEIMQKDLTDREVRIIHYENEFNLFGRKAMQKTHKPAKIYLPFDHTELFLKDIFYEVNLTTQDDASKRKNVELCNLLQQVKSGCVIVTGQPGAGKSTLLKRLRDDYLIEDTEPEIFLGVRKFPLLLYVECREGNVSNCEELLIRNFPKIMREVDNIADAFETLRGIDLLICIDGLDEINPTSRKLVDELIDRFVTFGKATLVITSRPSSVHDIKKKLEDKNIIYFTASINLLTDKSEQCSYLRRYENKLPGVTAPKLIESFEQLDLGNSWETPFSYPIYLLLFCCLYKKYPNGEDEWKSEVSIMEEVLKLGKENVVARLNKLELIKMNLRTLASDLMDDACDLTLCLLNEDNLVIDERNYSKMCKKCFKDLPVPYQSIVSCLFLGQPDCEVNFQFLHKSHAEYMAAKALFRRLASNPETKVFNVIAEVTSESFWSNMGSTLTPEQVRKGRERIRAAAFLNVFRFVAILLVKTGGKGAALESFLGEIRPALVEEKIAFDSFAEFTLSCGQSELVVSWAAMAAKEASEDNTTNRPSWDVTSPRLMTAASKMLPHHQPPSMVVNIKENSGDITSEQKSFMEIVGKWFSGDISFYHEYSLRNFLPADDFLISLWSARCQIQRFEGCLGTNVFAWKAFVSAVRRTQTLPTTRDIFVSLSNPWLHQLHTLEQTSRYFVVTVRLDSVKLAGRGPPRPLPMNKERPTLLTIICTPDAEVDKVAALVTHLAPIDKLYSSVWLQHWQGEDSALDDLVTKLETAGLQTSGDCVTPSWESTSAEEIDDWVFWREEHSQGEHVVQLFLRNKTRWNVCTGEEMAQITQLLPREQPLCLGIEPTEWDGLPTELTPLLEAVRDWFPGNLELRFDLSFNYFLPADDYLLILSTAKCRLDVFEGCLGLNTEAWQVLADAVQKAKVQNASPNLQISLLEPRFHQLNMFKLDLEVIIAQLKPGSRRRCSLPLLSDSSPPKLVLVCPSSVTAADAAALIEDLVPEGNCYDWLGLVQWSGPESDLEDLLQTLALAGVRTAGEGVPRWQKKLTPSWDCSCWFCDYRMLPAGVSCVRLVIPRRYDHE